MRLLTEIEPMTFKLEGRHTIHCAEATASVFKAYICSKVKFGHSVCRTLVQIDDVIIRIKWRFEILKFPAIFAARPGKLRRVVKGRLQKSFVHIPKKIQSC